jgi:hypothetical protein
MKFTRKKSLERDSHPQLPVRYASQLDTKPSYFKANFTGGLRELDFVIWCLPVRVTWYKITCSCSNWKLHILSIINKNKFALNSLLAHSSIASLSH